MIIPIAILIIIIASALVFLLIRLDERVVEYHRKFIGDIIIITEELKGIRKSLHDVNKFVRFITQSKILSICKIITKAFDVISILLLFAPAKNKITYVKRFFSTKLLKYAYSLYKTITA